MKVAYDRYPGGKKLALTMSYDDGVTQDRRLIELFNKYGVKGSFHLNSGFIFNEGKIQANEISALYADHEVSVHTVHHPHLPDLSKEQILAEIIEDRRNLEDVVGYPIRGMSYPYGSYNHEIVNMLPSLGIVYSRTVKTHNGFHLPENFLEWEATCHHNGRLLENLDRFLNLPAWSRMSLLYVWGHSYEFDRDHNWEIMEQFCDRVGHQDNIWCATNIAIYDYVKALRSLQSTVRGDRIHNPSAISVWISIDGEAAEILPGQTLTL